MTDLDMQTARLCNRQSHLSAITEQEIPKTIVFIRLQK